MSLSLWALGPVALAVGLCLLPVRSESQARPALTPEDVKQINELTEAFAKGVLAKEWKTVSALYAENAVLYPPGETAVKGRTSIEACLAGLPGMTGFTVRTTSVEGRDDPVRTRDLHDDDRVAARSEADRGVWVLRAVQPQTIRRALADHSAHAQRALD